MIVLKTILSAGGACPYQLKATTEDGRCFYLMYKNGILTYAIASSFITWAHNPRSDIYEFSKRIGDESDGYADHSTIHPHLKDIVKFPAGFQISSKESEKFDATHLK